MRVLLISLAPVHRTYGCGNTFLNVMEHLDGVELTSICARAGATDARVSRAFSITERILLKNLLTGSPAGLCSYPAEGNDTLSAAPSEAKLQRFAHHHRWTVLFWARDLLWRISRWKSPELREFIEDFQPDVIFTYLSGAPHVNRLTLHAAKLSSRPSMLLRKFTLIYIRLI